ncbi:MAG: hypothetical protein JXA43_01355 [Candidatus Diapherotrites archaeon]|nr:hypothetical protein [Candidatus Diapherotrites archaeon]
MAATKKTKSGVSKKANKTPTKKKTKKQVAKKTVSKLKKKEDVIVTLIEETGKDEDKLIFYGLVIALIVTLVFAGYAVYKAQQPQPFSQVWLEEKTLPGAVDVGEVFSFQFTIDSHEIENATYIYDVAINNVKQVSGSIVLGPGEKRTMTARMAIMNESDFADDSAKIMINIDKNLPEQEPMQYSLWFWLNKR